MLRLSQIAVVLVALLVVTAVPSRAQNASGAFALQFDGDDDYVAIPSHQSINEGFVEDRTIEAWFKVDDKNIDTRKQVIWEEGGSTNGFNIYVFDGAVYVGAWSEDNRFDGEWLQTSSIQSGTWHHVALVWDNGFSLTGYLDGSEFGNSTTPYHIAPHGGDVAFGRMQGNTKFHDGDEPGNGHEFEGSIDEGRVWNIRRTESQIQNNRFSTLSAPVDMLFLDGYWPFEEGSGTTAFDVGADRFNLDGTLQNGVSWTSDDALPPVAPTGLATTAGNTQVDLAWDANSESDVDGYNVYRSTSSFSDPSGATKVNGSLVTGTSLTDTGLSNGITYHYRLTAVDDGGNKSSLSGEATATPAVVTYHVDGASGSDTNDGQSWGQAFATLQQALSVATVGDEIWIAEGIYYPDEGPGVSDNDRSASFTVASDQNGLKIYGGFQKGNAFDDRSPADHPVVLSGDIDQNDDTNGNDANSYTVLWFDGGGSGSITTDTVLDGVTVTAGNGDGPFNFNQIGGGLLCLAFDTGDGCSPTIANVIFANNHAVRGGAMGNRVSSDGTTSPTIINATFIYNSAASTGGALYNNGGSNGTASPTITNVTFSGNSASNQGGAIYNQGTGGTSTPQITNAILWGNSAASGGDEIFNNSASSTLSHTLIEGGVDGSGVGGDPNIDGGNNLDADPLFVDAGDPDGADDTFATGDDGLRVLIGSPAIDAGDDTALPSGVTTDITGAARIQDGTVDLGPYEGGVDFPPAAPTGLATTVGGEQVGLAWDANSESDLDGYNVYRSTSSFSDPSGATKVNESLVTGTSFADIRLSNGTTYHYRLTAVDDGGNESSLSGEAVATPSGAVVPYALQFDGVDDFVAVPDASELNLDPRDERTVEVWFKVDDKSIDTRKQVIWEEGGAKDGFNIYVFDGAVYVGVWSRSNRFGGVFLETSSIQSSTWHHVALVYDKGNSFTGYLDGSEFGSWLLFETIDSHGADNAFGRMRNDTRFHDGAAFDAGHELQGSIAEGRVWNVPRTQSQIQNNRFSTLSGTETGLAGYWPFEEGRGTSTSDVASGNNGRLQNGVSWTSDDPLPPAAPTGLATTAGDAQVDLAWDANSESDLDGYNVYRSTSSFSDPSGATKVNGSPVTGTSFTDTGLSNGTTYHYRITAVDDGGNESSLSGEAVATPDTYALQFDGVDDFVAVPSASELNLDPRDERTIEVWFKVNDKSINKRKQVIWEEGGATNGFNIYVFAGAVYVGAWSESNGFGGEWLQTSSIQSGTWHHVALVYDKGSSLTGYLDGSAFGSVGVSNTISSHAADNAFGAIRNDTKFHDVPVQVEADHELQGSIDEGRVWNTVRTQSQIQNNRFSTLSGNETGLGGYWPFEEGSGTSTSDVASGNAGTLQNGVSWTSDDPPLPPSAPTGLATTAGDAQVDLSWGANSESDLDGYNVYRSTSSFSDPSGAAKVNGSLVTGTSFTDPGLSNGTTYHYRLTAVDTGGNESSLSGEATATPTDQSPSVTYYVDGASGSDSNDGQSWGEAFATLQQALSVATGNDEIWIAEGTYHPDEGPGVTDDDRNARFTVTGDQNGLKFYGGFANGDAFGDRSPADHPVILSGDIDQNDATNADGVTETAGDINGSNSFHVLVVDGTSTPITTATIIDGVTVTGGQADDGDSSGEFGDNGGGLYCNGEGGTCNPWLRQIAFRGNAAEIDGGAIYNDGAEDGISSPQITHATFSGNSASEDGGAIYNVVFLEGTSSPTITNVTFSGNSADRGGAIYNLADVNGTTRPQITNAILWGNSAATSGDEIFNEAIDALQGDGDATPTLRHTLIEGGVNGSGVGGDSDNNDGGNNLGTDPLFLDPSDPDGADDTFATDDDGLRVQAGSPALDAGDDTALPSGVTTDVTGAPRIQDGAVDLGAYEGAAPMTLTIDGTPGADGADAGWRFIGIPTSVPINAGDLRLGGQAPLFDLPSGHMLQEWDDQRGTGTTGGYDPIESASETLQPGRGYAVFLFDQDPFALDPSMTIDVAGDPPPRGGQTVTINPLAQSAQWHLLANPYPTGYDLSSLTNLPGNGFQEAVQRYDATTDTWVVEDQPTTDLAAWQGFFIERTDPGGGTPGATTVSFNPAGRIAGVPFVGSKTEDTGPDVRRARLALGLTVTAAGGDTLSRDAAAQVLFDARATADWDPWDASKLTPLASEYALVAPEGTGRGDTLVSKAVESRPWPTGREEIPLRFITRGTPGTTATLSVREWALPDGWRARIVDTERGRKHILDAEATVEVTLPPDTTRPTPRYELQVAPTGAPLPVELSAFEAAQTGENGVRLTWQTASETNNAGFEIQRRIRDASDGRPTGAWEPVAFVEGAGTTSEPQTYRLTDTDLPFAADTLAYRLKQIDTDGTAHLSDAITVGRRAVQAVQLHGSFPNPARAQATIRYAFPRAADVRIALYDVLGRRVQVLARGERRSGRHEVSINVSRLASGLYLYRLSTDDGVSMTRKLQVIR